MKTFLLTMTAAGAIAIAVGNEAPAWAQTTTPTPTAYPTDVPSESDDRTTILQAGARNKGYAMIEVGGADRSMNIQQSGSDGFIQTFSDGSHTRTKVVQEKDASMASANTKQQRLTWGVIELTQKGAATANINQHDGYTMHVTAQQSGGATLDVEQTGAESFANIQQAVSATKADASTIKVTQLGFNDNVDIAQRTGMLSSINLIQGADFSGAATVRQFGNFNSIDVAQHSGTGTMDITQRGDHNELLSRYSGVHDVTLDQSGSRNYLGVGGGAWAGITGKVTQSGTDNLTGVSGINVSHHVSYDVRQSGTNNRAGIGLFN